jgi:hypothetical protein
MARRDINNARTEFKLPAAVLQAIDAHCAARRIGRSDWLRKAAQKVMREEVLRDSWAEQRRELDRVANEIAARHQHLKAQASVHSQHTTPFQRTKRAATTKRTDSQQEKQA